MEGKGMKKIYVFLTLTVLISGCLWFGLKSIQSIAGSKLEINKITVIKGQDTGQTDAKGSLDDAISEYLENKAPYRIVDGKVFETHELYGTEGKNNKIYAYIWSDMQEYALKSGKLVSGFNMSGPMVIIIERGVGGKYTVLDYKTPLDGERYFSSVKALFPAKYQDKILSRLNSNELDAIVYQKAQNYFNLPDGQGNSTNQASPNLVQEIKTPLYRINVPKDWKVDKRQDNTLGFKRGNAAVGGLDVMYHYSNQPVSTLLPNHSEVLEEKQIKDFPYNVLKVKLKLSQPAASSDKTIKTQLHYYFLINEFAYDLYFDSSYIGEPDAQNIAKSFQYIKALNSGKEKDGVLIKGTGYYVGQVDTNSIEINMKTATSTLKTSDFRLADSVLNQFKKLKLRKSDIVVVSYVKNGYNQLVLMSINKTSIH